MYPEVLQDGEDAVVSWDNVPNPTTSDYITVSCGDTLGLDDYIDAVFVGQFTSSAPITDVSNHRYCDG